MVQKSIVDSRKIYKKNRLMSILRSSHEPLSRFDLKKISGYSISTVLSLIDEMIEEGLLYEQECEENRVGRKPAWLMINGDGGYYAGLEFNAQKMNIVVMDLRGNILYQNQKQMDMDGFVVTASREDILALIIRMIRTALDHVPDRSKVLGIGIGSPGFVDVQTGVSQSRSRIPSWTNVPVKEILEKEFGLPCFVQNNVNVMTLAYKWLRYKGNSPDLTFISVRTGIRMVTISNNRVVSGQSGYAGELGHIHVTNGGSLCTCGRYGCLNSEVSDIALIDKIQRGITTGAFSRVLEIAGGNPSDIRINHYVQAVKEGDPEALKLMNLTAEILGRSLALIVNILAPSEIVLSGRQFAIGDPFLSRIREVVKMDAMLLNYEHLKIVKSEFGGEIGAIGAACMVMEEYFSYQDMEV